MPKRSLPILKDPESRKILKSLCKRHGLKISLIEDLISIQRDNLGRGRQIGISQEFNAAIAEFLDDMGNG